MKPEEITEASILVVDDSPTNLYVLLDYLRTSGFKTLIARSGEGALRQATFARPDLILLDVMMPDMDGFETCRRLKQKEALKDIPVIFLTALTETVEKIKGMEAGGVDYVTKPFDGLELLARVKTHLALSRYREELKRSNRELQQANEALVKAHKQLELVAKTDSLTQLSNRRDMLDKLEYEKIRFERSQRPFVLILCDIDHFKRFNDTYGHDCGDFVLVSVANSMQSIGRKQDWVARWGGEEFLLLLPETDLNGGGIFAEKIRRTIAEHSYQYKEQDLSITMTFGVSVFDDYALEIDECIKRADRALYKGKEQRRNCVVLFDQE